MLFWCYFWFLFRTFNVLLLSLYVTVEMMCCLLDVSTVDRVMKLNVIVLTCVAYGYYNCTLYLEGCVVVSYFCIADFIIQFQVLWWSSLDCYEQSQMKWSNRRNKGTSQTILLKASEVQYHIVLHLPAK